MLGMLVLMQTNIKYKELSIKEVSNSIEFSCSFDFFLIINY